MAVPNATYEADVNVTIGIWVRRSGAWQKVTQVQSGYYNSKNTGGSAAYSTTFTGSVQLGSGIDAFGATVDSVDGGNANSITINSVKWTAQGTNGGTRSALPNGATTTVTVRPK